MIPGFSIGSWHFDDTNLLSGLGGYPPRAARNLTLFPSWQSNAVEIASANALLQYNESDNGWTNIVCPNGTIYLWVLPYWSSASLSGGSGPGAYARLLEMGSYTTNASVGWFSLYLNPGGTNIFFAGQTNGAGATFLTGSVALTSNTWTFLALTYSPSNSFLFTNGQLCAMGSGVASWPGPTARTNGFCLGGDASGQNLVMGQLEWLRTYNYPVPSSWPSNFYQMVLNKYGGGGGLNGPLLLNGGICVTGGPVYMTNLVAIWETNQTFTLTFDVLGGTNGLVYDVFSTTNLVGNSVTNSQWVWRTNSYTCSTVILSNQPMTQTFYVLGTPKDSDGDGLTDAYERLVSKTNPNNQDTDGDGIIDGWEPLLGTNPLVDESGQTTQRSNFIYDAAGRLQQVFGGRSETMGIDGEGNVLQISQ